jgi:hypothetical protein
MDEFTLTMNFAQLEAVAIVLKAHRDHCNVMLGGIGQLYAQMRPPDPPTEADHITEVAAPAASSSEDT